MTERLMKEVLEPVVLCAGVYMVDSMTTVERNDFNEWLYQRPEWVSLVTAEIELNKAWKQEDLAVAAKGYAIAKLAMFRATRAYFESRESNSVAAPTAEKGETAS